MKKLFLFVSVYLMSGYIAFAFSGQGSGTASDPYQVTTIDQLQEMEDDLQGH